MKSKTFFTAGKVKFTGIIKISLFMLFLSVFLWQCRKQEILIVYPTVNSTDPVSNSTGTAVNSNVSAIFSTEMDPSSFSAGKFTLMQGTTNVAGTVEYSGVTASFNPSADLAPNTLYKATLTTGILDLAGTNLRKDYVWSFTTGAVPDKILPTITLLDPLNNAVAVSTTKLINITFSEPMDPATIRASTIILKQGSVFVSGTVTYTGNIASFDPSVDLNPATIYSVTVTSGVKDMSGNALAANTTFSFTTAAAPDIILPRINAYNPLNNATGVELNKVVSLTFSEAMDPLTINSNTFTLMQGTNSVSGNVVYSGNTASFTPAANLSAGLTYTATISGAKDLAGNAMIENFVWSFTTKASAAIGAVNLGAAENYVILAKTAITNNPTSAITGNLGLSPAATSYITGFSLTNATGYATSTQVTGSIFAADMVDPTSTNLTTAVNNMITAYNDAAGRPSPDFAELGTGNIGGKILTPGLYKWTNSVTMPSDVTISGNADDVWIFQIAQNLSMSNGVRITLEGGAQAKNIFWQVAGTVLIGTTAHFEGIVLSMTGITLQTGASFRGRALAQTAVVLDGNAVIVP